MGEHMTITAKDICENAKSRIIWHGRDAEAWAVGQAKESLKAGSEEGARVYLRLLREIRRQLEKNGPALLQQHYECARQMAEGESAAEERKKDPE